MCVKVSDLSLNGKNNIRYINFKLISPSLKLFLKIRNARWSLLVAFFIYLNVFKIDSLKVNIAVCYSMMLYWCKYIKIKSYYILVYNI